MKTLASPLRPLRAFAAIAALLAGSRNVAGETIVRPVGNAPADSTDVASQTPFTRDQLIAILSRSIGSHFNLEGDFQIDLVRAWTPPPRLAAAWDLAVLEFPSVPAASMMVRCRVLADAVPVSEATFVFRAQLWRDVWIARQPLTSGGLFDASLLETRRVDVLRDRDALPATVGDRNSIFVRAVPAGRMLTWRDVARRPLVRKGDVVEVSAVDGPLSVTMKALALENGAQGETVSVRNPESRKIFGALVVEENRVQIRF